ncbi:MAG: hypothetical protein HQ564_00390 [Candidatus Saganbacteria bacterium]|nr:hypothetical protein [Candidatus Saganbacteria bacterium]
MNGVRRIKITPQQINRAFRDSPRVDAAYRIKAELSSAVIAVCDRLSDKAIDQAMSDPGFITSPLLVDACVKITQVVKMIKNQIKGSTTEDELPEQILSVAKKVCLFMTQTPPPNFADLPELFELIERSIQEEIDLGKALPVPAALVPRPAISTASIAVLTNPFANCSLPLFIKGRHIKSFSAVQLIQEVQKIGIPAQFLRTLSIVANRMRLGDREMFSIDITKLDPGLSEDNLAQYFSDKMSGEKRQSPVVVQVSSEISFGGLTKLIGKMKKQEMVRAISSLGPKLLKFDRGQLSDLVKSMGPYQQLSLISQVRDPNTKVVILSLSDLLDPENIEKYISGNIMKHVIRADCEEGYAVFEKLFDLLPAERIAIALAQNIFSYKRMVRKLSSYKIKMRLQNRGRAKKEWGGVSMIGMRGLLDRLLSLEEMMITVLSWLDRCMASAKTTEVFELLFQKNYNSHRMLIHFIYDNREEFDEDSRLLEILTDLLPVESRALSDQSRIGLLTPEGVWRDGMGEIGADELYGQFSGDQRDEDRSEALEVLADLKRKLSD